MARGSEVGERRSTPRHLVRTENTLDTSRTNRMANRHPRRRWPPLRPDPPPVDPASMCLSVGG